MSIHNAPDEEAEMAAEMEEERREKLAELGARAVKILTERERLILSRREPLPVVEEDPSGFSAAVHRNRLDRVYMQSQTVDVLLAFARSLGLLQEGGAS